jgi:hypothetical protein
MYICVDPHLTLYTPSEGSESKFVVSLVKCPDVVALVNRPCVVALVKCLDAVALVKCPDNTTAKKRLMDTQIMFETSYQHSDEHADNI